MNYILLSVITFVISGGLFAYFSTYPPKAAVFPKLIIIFTFCLPALAALIKGIKEGDAEKFKKENMKKVFDGWKTSIKDPVSIKIFLLTILTILYCIGTKYIGFYPATVIYFFAVLLGIYKRPIKGTLIYTLSCGGFLYLFFSVIFKVRI